MTMECYKSRKNYIYKIHHYNVKTTVFMYVLFSTIFTVCLFLYGFFPIIQYDNSISTRDDIPSSINDTKIDLDVLYKPLVEKVIIMVIDGLRWDFVNNAHETNSMPETSKLLRNRSACLLQVKVNTPTVTMPRIKAMTTGTVSSFIDVAYNFGETIVSSDNLLLQAKNHGHKLIFYGDDTWLKLYPNIFFRHEGTTSFFVSDYIEVDNNVTRHLNDELNKNNDWSIMILHYLGLDHIGHLYGPQSSLIKPKLQEMDQIIAQISKKIDQWNKEGISSLLIVCGDHGMKNSGGHGGATSEEIFVPLVAYGINYFLSNSDSGYDKIEQIDIATTLSMMLGLPLPSSNFGCVSIKLIKNLSPENQLFMLYYNAIQVFEHFKKLPNYESYHCYTDYLHAIKLHSEEIKSNMKPLGKTLHTINLYYGVLEEVKDILVRNMIHYNLAIINAAIIMMFQILLIILSFNFSKSFTFDIFFYWVISSVFCWFVANYILSYDNNDTIEINNLLIIIPIIICFIINCFICAKISWKEFINNSFRNLNSLYLLSMIIYVISLISTSFVEEEHQTWYFFWTSFLLFEIINHISEFNGLYIRKFSNIRIGTIVKILLLLVIHRILRNLNSTGNKYAHLPNISGWIKNQESYTAMSIILLTALGLLFLIGFIIENKNHKPLLIFYLIMIICIYQRHAAENNVLKLPFLPNSRGIYEVKIFWITLIVFIIYSLRKIFYLTSKDSQTILKNLILLFTKIWISICALLHRPYNIIILPMQLITHLITFDIFKFKNDRYLDNEDIQTFLSYCLGNVFYFYQGNSNSLATIDVAAGYVGLESYNFYIATLFLSLDTFSAPVLSYLILLCNKTSSCERENNNSRLFSINQKYTIFILFSLTVYTIIVNIERYHLFIWTVFSPKLLYVAVHCATFFIVIILIQILDILIKKK